MSLPIFSKSSSHKLTNYEPLYPNLFEVVISNDDIDLVLVDVINVNYVNGSLVISVRDYLHPVDDNIDDNMDYVKRYFRQDKINRLLGDESKVEYEILLSLYDAKGMVIKRVNFLESEFTGNSDNMFHFSYKNTEERDIKTGEEN